MAGIDALDRFDEPPTPRGPSISAADFEASERQGELQRSLLPAAVAVRYDGETDRLIVILDTGVELAFAPRLVQGLGCAEVDDLTEAEISPSGHGLHFPRLNADVYLPGLLEGVMGTRRWMRAMARAAPLRAVPWQVRRP
ncbi:DUF2442 domain-containing protein [Roseateles chitosanitabidus]|jgi:hypothetical protein|uniref:DUF2442 domain-containing protein n=1 Tax=Roseateles chitosanitabidus TaxID=65048 RepID=UPI0008356CA7|nr:DUF2442 domain-containing protein [Roseateles chitosanitabidus]MBO9686905.1 DUF2442 domain-containing protein [Roseateles chitosanitabidus]